MERKSLILVSLINLLFGVSAQGQTYVSSFSEVKYDRAKTPTTFHGGATVDVPSGALSYDAPLGPGIGARGLRFIPRLSSRFSPQTPPPKDASPLIPTGISCSMSPGYLILGYGPGSTIAEYRLPDGTSGQFSVNAAAPVDALQIARSFGYSSTEVTAAAGGFISADGVLWISLVGPAYQPNITLYAWQPTLTYPAGDTTDVPRGMLVVSADGKTATEYRYLNPQYAKAWSGNPSPSGSGYAAQQSLSLREAALAIPDPNGSPNNLNAIHYLPVSWRNRFGDVVSFNHAPLGGTGNGVDYDATWTWKGGAALASVQMRLVAPVAGDSTPAINSSGVSNGGFVSSGGRIKVSYTGANQSSYTLDAWAAYGDHVDQTGVSWGMPSNRAWDDFRRNLQPHSLTVDDTGEAALFEYQPGYVTSDNMIVTVTLKSLSLSKRKTSFSWAPYKYRKPDGNLGYRVSNMVENNDTYTAVGVTQVDDQDLSDGGQTRTTRYERVVPIPDSSVMAGPNWTSTAFWVAVNHPDGQVTTNRFAEPLNGVQVDNLTPANAYQSAAHLKHVVVDARSYTPGQDWRNDMNLPPLQSVAYSVAVSGIPVTGTPGSSTTEQNRFAVGPDWINPYWNFVNAAVPNTVNQLGWFIATPYSTQQESWKRDTVGAVNHRVEVRTNWDTVGGGWRTPLSVTADLNGVGILTRATVQAYESDWSRYFLGRIVQQQQPGQPVTAFTFNPDNTLSFARVNPGGTPELRATYGYSGLPDPVSVSLSSPNLALSGSVGATYDFDSYGLTNKITPNGVGWFLGEAHDVLGRPTSQSGANSETTSLQWDSVGRLSSAKPDPELATSIAYPDLQTAVATHGQQQTTEHFNGFGELIKEDRQGGSRTFQYDLAGRKTFESVWGDSTKGTFYSYEPQGRISQVTDPNGEITQYIYEGPKTRILHGGVETQKIADSLGQLSQSIDALSQVTAYNYDDAGRIVQVTQAGSGVNQVRTWHYNSLGWLDQLVQPENGTTAYGAFTVQGKPQTTTYNNTLVLTTPLDSLGRLTGVSSSDGSVSQSLTYGENETGHGMSNNKLVRAISGSRVTRVMNYNGSRGRLSNLVTTLDGTDFPQQFGYDASTGQLTSHTYPSGTTQSLVYDLVKELPSGTSVGGANLATMVYDSVHWGLTNITFSNNASTTFAYGDDQVRLKHMWHLLGTQTLRDWAYLYNTTGTLRTDGEDVYTYDPLNRLTSATIRDIDSTLKSTQGSSFGIYQSFDYDAFGNRASLNSMAVTNWPAGQQAPAVPQLTSLLGDSRNFGNYNMSLAERQGMAATNHLPSFIGGVMTGAIYDTQGNLTSIQRVLGSTVDAQNTQLSMTYDASGRIVTMSDPSKNTVELYTYDDQGLRVVAETYLGFVALKNLLQKKYRIYNDARQLLSEYDLVLE